MTGRGGSLVQKSFEPGERAHFAASPPPAEPLRCGEEGEEHGG